MSCANMQSLSPDRTWQELYGRDMRQRACHTTGAVPTGPKRADPVRDMRQRVCHTTGAVPTGPKRADPGTRDDRRRRTWTGVSRR